ncbi:MAG: electron transport complex subunit E [Alphaproteobacteria bacterium]|nr:electron transport complex subunit E [Alphaproteobacteria bacterium]
MSSSRNRSNKDILINGVVKNNPVFVMLLGMCPVLGVTTSAINGLGMGGATLFVLLLSNITISVVKSFIPDKVRIPAFIVLIASFVTVVEMLMEGYLPALHEALGLFIPLIVVNCIILGRAEAFASKNTVFHSILDALGMGTGFTLALTILGSVREILGNGSIFGCSLVPTDFNTFLLFVMPPGAFLALGYLVAMMNKLNREAN